MYKPTKICIIIVVLCLSTAYSQTMIYLHHYKLLQCICIEFILWGKYKSSQRKELKPKNAEYEKSSIFRQLMHRARRYSLTLKI